MCMVRSVGRYAARAVGSVGRQCRRSVVGRAGADRTLTPK